MSDTEHTSESTYKTRITLEEIQLFLNEKYLKSVANLTFIKGGETSQAFSFDHEDKAYILRVNKHNSLGYEKDEYAHKHFSSATIPVPEILEIGKIGEYNYAISERSEGRMMEDFPENDFKETLSQVIKTLDELHHTPLPDNCGYGYWDKDGKGKSNSWKEEILVIAKEPWRKWDEHFKSNTVPKELFDMLYGQLKELVQFCPEDKYLIHGDFGFENLLSDGEKVTGVIDWSESKYGDFLFDVSWMSFWPYKTDYIKIFKDYYKQQGRIIKNFDERVVCYHIYIGLGVLGFYALSNQKEKYDWAKGRIMELIN